MSKGDQLRALACIGLEGIKEWLQYFHSNFEKRFSQRGIITLHS